MEKMVSLSSSELTEAVKDWLIKNHPELKDERIFSIRAGITDSVGTIVSTVVIFGQP